MTLEKRYKNTYWWYIALECVLLSFILLPVKGMMVYISVFLVLFLAGMVLYRSMYLYKAIPGIGSLPLLFLGVVFVLGGSAFDITATVTFSPDLSEEGNPVVVALLNNNCSIAFIYLFMLFYQILKVSINLYLWACFLKTYPNILKSIPCVNFFTTIKWLMGFGKMTLSDFLLSKNVQFYFLFSSLSFITLMLYSFRWYVALEWLGVVPYPNIMMCILGIIFFSFLTLALVTHFKIKQAYMKKICISLKPFSL